MNYLTLHKEFRSLGCADEAQTAAACQLYIELCEVRKKLNVKYYFSEEFNCIYLTASDKNDEIDSIYLPITSNASINLIATETIHRTLIQKHAHESIDADRVDFILAIVDPTTTVVYYKLTLSLAMKNHQTNPNSPEQQPSESICQ